MQRFAQQNFLQANHDEREALCRELASVLCLRIAQSGDFHSAVQEQIDALRALGHDLWSFDESDQSEAWCPDYTKPALAGLCITFTRAGVLVDWSSG